MTQPHCFTLNNLQFVLYSYVVLHVFICICTCLAMFTCFYVCLDCRGRVVTKVVRTCDPTPLLYKNLAIKYVGLELAIDPPPPQGEFCTL